MVHVMYVVTADTCLPEGCPELDPLQRAGAVHLLTGGLEDLEAVEGPDGVEIEVDDFLVAVHPGGAILKLFVDAPALEFAEDAVRHAVAEVLERSELLASWTIEKCQVELHPELTQRGLDAADGPEGPPTDPANRAAQHAEARAAASASGPSQAGLRVESERMRRKIRSLAPQLQAFGLESFGYSSEEEDEDDAFGVSREAAELAAGALVYSTTILVDHLFNDVITLSTKKTKAAEREDVLWVLEELPAHYALQYTALFARRLHVTAVALTARLTQPHFGQLSCVAEELLLRILLTEAEVVLETCGLLDDEVANAWEIFRDEVYEDLDHEWLYNPAMDGIDEDPRVAHLGIAPMGVRHWFSPFNEGRYVHPYAADDEANSDDGGENEAR